MPYPSSDRLIGRARERIWLGIEKEISAEVLIPHRSLVLRVVNEVLAAFAELMDTEDMSEGTWKGLNALGEEASQQMAWSLLDALVLEILTGVVAAAEDALVPAAIAARRLTLATNEFFNGFWVFEDGAAIDQAVRFGRLAHRIPTPVFITDLAGTVTFVNHALGDLLGQPLDQLVGRNIEDVLGGEVLGGDLRTDLELVTGGTTRFLRIDVMAVPGDAGFEHFGMVTDRTNEVLLERARDRVIATISHELRTPLTVVVGYLELLAEETATPGFNAAGQEEALRVMRGEADLLLRLVNDLVDIASLESGAVNLDPKPFPLLSAVENAARRAGVDPVLDIPDATIFADQDRIEQALGNLLSNARRYGGSTIGIAARIDDTGAALIRVWDDGPGIAPEYRERLFDTFIRAHDIPGLGSGIGLAVCRAVARAHGGDVVLEDGPKRHSC